MVRTLLAIAPLYERSRVEVVLFGKVVWQVVTELLGICRSRGRIGGMRGVFLRIGKLVEGFFSCKNYQGMRIFVSNALHFLFIFLWKSNFGS